MTIFLVEDEENIRELVLYTLRAGGHDAQGFCDAPAFYAALKAETPDLVLLDIMLPGEDGLAVLEKLRQGPKTKDIPVIMLTAKDSEYDKVLGLDKGADDYLAKPFGMMELLSRIRAVARRSGAVREEEAVCRVGEIELFPAQHRVSVAGREVALTVKEFELLHLLLQNPQIVFTRDRLLERVWGFFDGETRTVDVHIGSLRQKLGGAGEAIETVRGVGYRLRQMP